MAGFGALLASRADDAQLALLYEDTRWSYRDLVDEGRRRAGLLDELLDPERPPHIGVLLDNVPDYLFWLTAGALSGAVIVGINSTYRGEQLAQLIDHTDCQVLVTDRELAGLLAEAAHDVPPDHVLVVDDPLYRARLDAAAPLSADAAAPDEDDLFALIFTSGSTGMPKAVRCTQGRIARTGMHVATIAELTPDDVIYAPLPFFHAASLFTAWAAAVHAGVPVAIRKKFSTSATVPDIRKHGVTFLTYTGKVLNYILSAPEQDDDATVPLRLAIGNEASEGDIREFARRFDCHVRDSYGSTEGVIIVRRDPSMPPGALGIANDTVKVLDSETGVECPRATRRRAGPSDEPRGRDGRTRRDPADLRIRGLLQERGGHEGALPRRRLLVGRSRLPRPGRVALLRRPLERVAPGRRRELRGGTGGGHHRPPSRRPLRRGLRSARRSRRRPGHGRPRAAGRRDLRCDGVR